MLKKQVISLYDYTGVAVTPWANAGYECFCYDIQHPKEGRTELTEFGGIIHYQHLDLHNPEFIEQLQEKHAEHVAFMFAFPVCTDLAVSGAAHFKRKAEKDPDFQIKAANYARWCSFLGEALECPYVIENPVSVLSTLWRKPDYSFQPFEFGGYIPPNEAEHPTWPAYIAPRDAYSKKTCLWSGGGFRMPKAQPVECESYGSSTQHRKLGGKSEKTKNIRSATPRGFANAVFMFNA